MDVMLVNAPVTVRNEHSRLALPLGLAYIGSSLIERGYRVAAIDFNVSGLNMRRVDAMMGHDAPKVVGVSANTETITNGLAIARRVKELAPGTHVVFGGAHPTIMPAEVLAEGCVDFVVVGAGERSMADLVAHLLRGEGTLDSIGGLAWLEAGELRQNPRAELASPDDLPWPARHLFPIEFYVDKWTVLTATGSCPYRCPFCSASSVWQGRHKLRSPESIVDEVTMLIEREGAERVFFSDDILTVNRRWALRLTDALRAMPHRVRWGCATRVDCVDDELLAAMAESGCDGIQFGVESGCQTILDSVKGIRKEQVLEAVRSAVAHGIEVVSSFIVPFPEDTRETLAETHAFIKDVHAAGSRILLSYTCPYPGTMFYERAEELGLNILTDRWEEFDAKHVTMETRNLGRDEIEEIVEAIAADVGLLKSV